MHQSHEKYIKLTDGFKLRVAFDQLGHVEEGDERLIGRLDQQEL